MRRQGEGRAVLEGEGFEGWQEGFEGGGRKGGRGGVRAVGEAEGNEVAEWSLAVAEGGVVEGGLDAGVVGGRDQIERLEGGKLLRVERCGRCGGLGVG